MSPSVRDLTIQEFVLNDRLFVVLCVSTKVMTMIKDVLEVSRFSMIRLTRTANQPVLIILASGDVPLGTITRRLSG